jgi:FMN phosphatase YigB (HAD superfamily)
MMEEMGFQSKDTILIGNSVKKDIVPAHELGIKTILFDPYNKHQDKPKEADFVIMDLIEIVDIVKK